MATDLSENDPRLFAFLNDISQALESINLKHMIFLLYDSELPRSKLESVQCGTDLFELLIDAKMMSLQFLGDFLALIRRRDLQEDVREFSRKFQVPSMCASASKTACVPTSLRKLIYRMAIEMSSEIVDEFICYFSSLSHGDRHKDALDILDHFIKDMPIRSIQDIPEKFEVFPKVIKLYQKHVNEFEQTDGAEEIVEPSSVEEKARLSSLFSWEGVPTFETEYSQIKDLDVQADNREATELGRGTFGVINTGIYKNKEVEVKSFYEAESIDMNELKMIVYLRHPFLLSIIRAEFSPRLRLVYCMKPKRNLAKFLKDTERLQESSGRYKRNAELKKRVKILCQISDALSFLHTPVANIRGQVIHMNVKPQHIFLDAFDNALLGDIDTAVEIQDGDTHRSVEVFETEGYADRYNDDRKKIPSYDVFSFGIVTLQVLKWQPASVTDDNRKRVELFDRVSEMVCSNLQQPIKSLTELDQLNDVVVTKDFFDETIWTSSDTSQTIGRMAFQCLLKPDIRITAEKYSAKLKEILNKCHHKKLWEENDNRCIQCHFHDINGVLKTTSKTCTKDCVFHNRFCRDCHYYSFRSPLHCPSHGIVHSIIGNPKNYAILICGYDSDSLQYKAFQKDIDYVKRTITDPRIMNISSKNLLVVQKGRIENTATFEAQVSEKLVGGKVEFLFVYYSGHGIKNDIIKVTEKEEDTIEIQKLRELLGHIQCECLLILFDCCFAAETRLVPNPPQETYKWITILYSSDAETRAICDAKKGSIFTRYFLAGLQSTQTCVCQEKNKHGKCQALETFRANSAITGFIELQNLAKYICDPVHDEPVNQKPQKHNQEWCSIACGKIIAYYNKSQDPVAYNFRFIHLPSKVEIPIQLEQIDHSASELEEAVLRRLYGEIEKYAPIADVHLPPNTKFQLKSEAGKEINTVEDFKKQAMRNLKASEAFLKEKEIEHQRNIVVVAS